MYMVEGLVTSRDPRLFCYNPVPTDKSRKIQGHSSSALHPLHEMMKQHSIDAQPDQDNNLYHMEIQSHLPNLIEHLLTTTGLDLRLNPSLAGITDATGRAAAEAGAALAAGEEAALDFLAVVGLRVVESVAPGSGLAGAGNWTVPIAAV